jgi:hypothetical protein
MRWLLPPCGSSCGAYGARSLRIGATLRFTLRNLILLLCSSTRRRLVAASLRQPPPLALRSLPAITLLRSTLCSRGYGREKLRSSTAAPSLPSTGAATDPLTSVACHARPVAPVNSANRRVTFYAGSWDEAGLHVPIRDRDSSFCQCPNSHQDHPLTPGLNRQPDPPASRGACC